MEKILENIFYEALTFKSLEAIWFLTGANEAGGDTKFLLNGSGDASFARAVELGEDESVERNRFLEFAGLVESISSS